MATIGPQEDIGTSKETLKGVRRQADGARLESVQPRRDADIESGKAGAGKRNHVEQAEVTEVLDEHHKQ